MSKNLKFIEVATIEQEVPAVEQDIVKLDDLSLALIGGGDCVVSF